MKTLYFAYRFFAVAFLSAVFSLTSKASFAPVTTRHHSYFTGCSGGGGTGPNTLDVLSALAAWVEKKQAPQQIVAARATNGQADRPRPAVSLSTGRHVQRQQHR